MFKTLFLFLCGITTLFASGWKLSYQSTENVALSGANIASAHGASSSYSNPANMAFVDESSLSLNLLQVTLEPVTFQGTYTSSFNNSVSVDAKAKKESATLSNIFYTTEINKDFSFGLAFVVPGGFSKRWENEAVSKLHSKEFTLEIVELNPSLSYKIDNTLAVGAGVRALYSKGVLHSSGTAEIADGFYSSVSRDLEGKSIDYGYNLALSYHPTPKLSFAATYRSLVDLTLDGDAKLNSSATFDGAGNLLNTATVGSYNGNGALTAPLPATASLALSYSFGDTLIEGVYEKTYWSAYKELDFHYSDSISGYKTVITTLFDNPKQMDWRDTQDYRVGLTHTLENLKLMAGFATDNSPSSNDKISFDSPNADGKVYSFGASYLYTAKLTLNFGYLKVARESLLVHSQKASSSQSGLNGEFDNTGLSIVAFGLGYRY